MSADRRRAALETADTGGEPAAARSESDRLADHAEIDRLTDDLVWRLMVKH